MDPYIIDFFICLKINKRFAPGEARTHGLQIMRLTRCLLRYGGLVKVIENTIFVIFWLSNVHLYKSKFRLESKLRKGVL